MSRVSMTLSLDAGMHAGICRRADTMGRSAADYVRNLIEAAFAARVGREKQLPAGDHELDTAVRAIFCLAGEFDVRAIAKATGFPESMVRDVLKGFAIVAKTLPADAVRPERAVSRVAPVRGWTPDRIEQMQLLWAEGKSINAIAKTLGKTTGSVEMYAYNHRDLFPKRGSAK